MTWFGKCLPKGATFFPEKKILEKKTLDDPRGKIRIRQIHKEKRPWWNKNFSLKMFLGD